MARPLLWLLCILPVAVGAPADAQHLGYEDVLDAGHRAAPRLAYAAPAGPAAEAGPERVRAFYGDRAEWRPQRGADAYVWDVSAELGGASHRLWLATTGDGSFGGPLDYVEAQALYSRPIGASGLAFQAGLRQDFVPRPRRSYAVLGVQGNASEPLYVGAFGFLSHEGEFTARLFAYYDLPLAGGLILQPAIETEAAAADVAELGIGSGPASAAGSAGAA